MPDILFSRGLDSDLHAYVNQFKQAQGFWATDTHLFYVCDGAGNLWCIGGGTNYMAMAGLTDVLLTSATQGQIVRLNNAGKFVNVDDTFLLKVDVDGHGSQIGTGEKWYGLVPANGEIVSATVLADQTGDIVVDIWAGHYSDFPLTDAKSICPGHELTISTGRKVQDATLTGWTKALTAGDVLTVNVDSCTTIQKVTVLLALRKT